MLQFNSTLAKIEKNLVAAEMKKTNLVNEEDMHKNVTKWKCRPDNILGIENSVSKSHRKKATLQIDQQVFWTMFPYKTFSSSLELAELCESSLSIP